MSAIDELISRITDENLRANIQREVAKLSARKKFGLVFEEHLPECTPLYGRPLKPGAKAALRNGKITKIYTVLKMSGEKVLCLPRDDDEPVEIPANDLVSIAEFGEAIYPYLREIDSVCNDPENDLWHVLIEAENYHALQLLEYICAGKVDCIYIDPPYNTGARDWKYNNDYVDGNDAYRHSKWLSFMSKRLKLAKNLLSQSGCIFISIDDGEACSLKLLCDDIFGNNNFVACLVWQKKKGGSNDSKYIATEHEYILVYARNVTELAELYEAYSEDYAKRYNEEDDEGRYYWDTFKRKAGKQYYPITCPDGTILQNDEYGNPLSWLRSKARFEADLKKGDIRFVQVHGSWSVQFKQRMPQGKTPRSIIADKGTTSAGSTELHDIFKSNVFPNPKPVELIAHLLRIATKPDALILDFFAGSGTTLHAVNLLNAEDSGHRRCIIVTNNEVSESESRTLTEKGFSPGTPEWDSLGIARYVTWPRTVCAIKGIDTNGQPLKGTYTGSDIAMSDGFKSNAVFFSLGFLDKDSVALGRKFREILPLLWLKSGAFGKCPAIDGGELPAMLILPENKFAVLNDESLFMDFEESVNSHREIETVFIVTDYDSGFRAMARSIHAGRKYQLYRDYLDNFRINHQRS